MVGDIYERVQQAPAKVISCSPSNPSKLLARLALTPQLSRPRSKNLGSASRYPHVRLTRACGYRRSHADSVANTTTDDRSKYSDIDTVHGGRSRVLPQIRSALVHDPALVIPSLSLDSSKQNTSASSFDYTTDIEPPHMYGLKKEDDYKYCVASPFNPYSLSSVHHGDIGDDFYLASSSGLTHRQKHGGVEFVTLHEHGRQAILYTALKSIHFFHRFPKWRTFMAWRKSTKSQKLCRCKKALQHELFFLHPTHRVCLLRLRLICQQLWDQRLFDVRSTNCTGSITEFCDRQAHQKFKIETRITKYMGNVHELVLQCCRKSLADFLDDCGFGVTASGGGYTQRAAMRAHCQKLVKFLRLVDFQIAEVYLQIATMSVSEITDACLEADRVLDSEFTTKMQQDIYTREAAASAAASPNASLASAIALEVFSKTKSLKAVADAVARAVITSEEGDVSEEEGRASSNIRQPLFRVSLKLVSPVQELMPQPSGLELRAHIEHIITDGLSVLVLPPRLLSDKEFSPFVTAADEENAIDQSPELSNILSLDQNFQAMLSHIYACINNASMYAVAYSRGFDRFMQSLREHDIFLQRAEFGCPVSKLEDVGFGTSSPCRGSAARDGDNLTEQPDTLELTIAELETLLARYVAESAVFAALPETQCIGVMLVDSSNLCSACRPSPEKCLRVARMHGPQVYNTRANVLLQKLAQQHEALITTPVHVDDYVKLTQTLKIANRILPTLHDACDLLGILHALLIAYGTPIPETTLNCAVLLKNLDTQVRQSLNSADTSVQEGAPQFIEQINTEVGTLQTPLRSSKAEFFAVLIEKMTGYLRTSFSRGVFYYRLELEFLTHPAQDPTDARRHLDQVSLMVSSLVERIARVRRYQVALQQDPLDVSDIILLVHKLASLKQLWCAAEGWRSQTAVWMEVNK